MTTNNFLYNLISSFKSLENHKLFQSLNMAFLVKSGFPINTLSLLYKWDELLTLHNRTYLLIVTHIELCQVPRADAKLSTSKSMPKFTCEDSFILQKVAVLHTTFSQMTHDHSVSKRIPLTGATKVSVMNTTQSTAKFQGMIQTDQSVHL